MSSVDDRFVIARPGDEIAIRFNASTLPPLPDGWTHTFLLYGDGFSKEMDLNSASPDQVEPLPVHGMRMYPPEPGSEPDPAHVEQPYDSRRRVVAPLPSIDAWLLLSNPAQTHRSSTGLLQR